MTFQDVVLQYEGRLLELQSALSQLRWPQALAAGLLAIALGLFFALSLYAFRGQLSFLWPSLPIPVAAASARRLRQARQSKSRLWRLQRFYDRAIERIQGNGVHSGSTGEEFIDPSHVYASDLNVFGEGSLFQMLCGARTSIGRRGLANYLLEAPALEETLLRQEAVRELKERTDLREKVATLGEFEFLESHHDTFDNWLNSPRLSFPRLLPAIAVVTSALLAAFVVTGLLGLIPWIVVAMWSAPLIAFHTAIGLVFRRRVNRMADSLRPVSIETSVLRDGLQLLETEQFRSPKLREISEQVRNGSRFVRKLERLLDALGQRDKDWFAGPSRALLAGTQLCMAVERWQRKHSQSLRTWVEAWAEFEALNALAAYGYENPENAFPELTGEPACLQASELGHPLLPRSSCVTNDIELGTDRLSTSSADRICREKARCSAPWD